MDRDNELGDFLRARRDLVSPQQAGLPDDADRRVNGLRREEVALLAGVSTGYDTRLEQGRERRPSAQVLNAIARALQLDAHAATHLFRIAQPDLQAAALVLSPAVSSELLRLMDHFLDAPACVLRPALDVLVANPQAVALYSGFARLDYVLRMVFVDPAAPDFYLDWERPARGAVSNFRAASAPYQDDPRKGHPNHGRAQRSQPSIRHSLGAPRSSSTNQRGQAPPSPATRRVSRALRRFRHHRRAWATTVRLHSQTRQLECGRHETAHQACRRFHQEDLRSDSEPAKAAH
jgi:transcriptional regulator with XRE-family HTH domain